MHDLTNPDTIQSIFKKHNFAPNKFLGQNFLVDEEVLEKIVAAADIKEGDGTILDNTLIFAHSDVSYARTHSLDGIPMFTAGRAGGRIKTGMHIAGGGTAGTRLGYTMLRAMGLDVTRWGTQSNETLKEIGEILV